MANPSFVHSPNISPGATPDPLLRFAVSMTTESFAKMLHPDTLPAVRFVMEHTPVTLVGPAWAPFVPKATPPTTAPTATAAATLMKFLLGAESPLDSQKPFPACKTGEVEGGAVTAAESMDDSGRTAPPFGRLLWRSSGRAVGRRKAG